MWFSELCYILFQFRDHISAYTLFNHSKSTIMTISEIEKTWFWDACAFSFYFDTILIVLLIVIFDKSLSSGSLLLFLEELLVGKSHWPYKEDNLYWLSVCFGASPISHEIVTKFVMFKMFKAPIQNWIV